MSRDRSNCSTILVVPSELDEVISVTPEMFASGRSRGVATEVAIVSALAPGSFATTWIVGKSTCGKGATGSTKYATPPASSTAIARNVVAMRR